MPKLHFEIGFKDGGRLVWHSTYEKTMRYFGDRILWIEAV